MTARIHGRGCDFYIIFDSICKYKLRVQYKIYCKDAWGYKGGYSALLTMSALQSKPMFAKKLPANPREMALLDEFIYIKDKQIMQFVHVTETIEAIY